MRKKTEKSEKEFVDDGRTIADMSGVERPGMFGHLPESWKHGGSESGAGRCGNGRHADGSDSRANDDQMQNSITRKERHMYTRAAVKAGLLIGLVYIVGCSVVIGILYLAWVVF
ncbi:MAG: hypothetical protein LIP10_01390 [Clostridiales bacterium]|nr:hypothetical protein [Clostridiales bacterium]